MCQVSGNIPLAKFYPNLTPHICLSLKGIKSYSVMLCMAHVGLVSRV